MKYFALTLVASVLAGCESPKWKPQYDPRSATNPREIIRDTLECERLMETVDEFGGVPKGERLDFSWFGGAIKRCITPTCYRPLPDDYNPMAKCMSARGHKILNWN